VFFFALVPAAGRQAGFPLLADRVGVCVRKPEAAGFEKNDRCTGYLIVLLAYEVQYLICLEFRGRFTLFETKARISVNEIRRNCENLILKRPAMPIVHAEKGICFKKRELFSKG